MSASKKSNLDNVVVYQNDIPHWELTADEVVFPLEFDAGDDSIIALFHCDAQIKPFEIKAVLSSASLRYKQSDSRGARDLEIGDDARLQEFSSKHFRRLSGPMVEGDPTPEACQEWLGENPAIRARIFREGYDRVLLDDAQSPARLTLTSAPQIKTHTQRILYCPDRRDIVRLSFVHATRKETEVDRVKHRKAIRITERGRYQSVTMNFDVIGQLYDQLIRSVDGFLVNGQPCVDDNRKEWIDLVPFNDKVFVVGRIFSASTLKNG